MPLYIPQAFHGDVNLATLLIKHFPLGTFTSFSAAKYHTSFLPMLLLSEAHQGKEQDNKPAPLKLIGHMARANPHTKALMEREAWRHTISFIGPEAYVSPTLYQTPNKHVPTWNYVSVLAEGTVLLLSEIEQKKEAMRLLTSAFESEDSGWSMEALDPIFLTELLAEITVFEFYPTKFQCKTKMSQNREDTDKKQVLRHFPKEKSYAPFFLELSELSSEGNKEPDA